MTQSSDSRRLRLRCAVGLVAAFSYSPLLNSVVFPFYDRIFPTAREISTVVSIVSLVALAFLATWKPSCLEKKYFTGGILIGGLVGCPCVASGIVVDAIPLILLGASLCAITQTFKMALVMLACTQLSSRDIGLCVSAAIALSLLIGSMALFFPPQLGFLIFALLPFAAVMAASPCAGTVFERAREATPAADLAITQPSSFLPFGHHFFVCLFLFKLACGYALTFGEIDGTPVATLASAIPVIIVFFVLRRKDGKLHLNGLFAISYLLVVLGFMLYCAAFSGVGTIVNTLLAAGSGCFDVLVWSALISLGAKSTPNAVPAIAWGSASRATGMLLGANLGRYCGELAEVDTLSASFMITGIAFLFIVFGTITLKSFDFSSLTKDVLPEYAPEQEGPLPITAELCQKIGKAYRLTPRETEVLELLARGRNVQFIQDKLTISRNTVKTHVRSVYMKLEVHTQQELIDLAEKMA